MSTSQTRQTPSYTCAISSSSSVSSLGFFGSLFEVIGIRVVDTGEEFTCRLRGDVAEFAEGIDESGVDFVVDIRAFQVERLASHIRTGELDEVEQFRVLTNVFGPVANSGFNNPAVGMFMTGRFFFWQVVLDTCL